jgi:FkbM family methyltransferase
MRARRVLDRLRRREPARRMAGPQLFAAFADAYPDASFVEIGSNDGTQHDHLRPFILGREWRGIMVEPVPYVYQRLRENYGHVSRVALANVAIAEREGELDFFHLAEAPPVERASLPQWYDGIGSFSREAVLAHDSHIPDIAERVVTLRVRAVTFDMLLEAHGLERVDLVLIDTEGYDSEILHSIDLAAHRPRLVVYEHYHLARETRAATLAYMARHGYETMEEHFDTFCLDTAPADSLTRTWRGLRPAVPGASKAEEAALR